MEYIAHIKDDDASDGVNRIEETVTEHSEKWQSLQRNTDNRLEYHI